MYTGNKENAPERNKTVESRQRKVTRKDVAEEAGVSETIVSYVLNKNRYVKEEKRQRVLEAVEKLQYQPNNIARALHGKGSLQILFIAEELSKQGIRNIVMHNVSHTSHSFIIADVFKYKGLIVGCPTYNTQMYPEMEALLSKLASREIKGRYLGYFGSFTWASAAVKKIAEFNDKLKFEPVGNPVEMKHSMKAETNTQAKELAKAMADRLKADRK